MKIDKKKEVMKMAKMTKKEVVKQNAVEASIRKEFDLMADENVKIKMGKAIAVANFSRKVIAEKKLFCEINNNKYVYVRGWKLIANGAGFIPEIDPDKTKLIRERVTDGDRTYTSIRCEAWAYLRTPKGEKVGYALGTCSNDEKNWAGRDETAIVGMAQTRAIGRACKNALDWLVTMAGYADVPVEELTDNSAPANGQTERTADIDTEAAVTA